MFQVVAVYLILIFYKVV